MKRRRKVSDELRFELVQPGETFDYYYMVTFNRKFVCYLRYDKKYSEWLAHYWNSNCASREIILLGVANKLNELNTATKADKLFGFL